MNTQNTEPEVLLQFLTGTIQKETPYVGIQMVNNLNEENDIASYLQPYEEHAQFQQLDIIYSEKFNKSILYGNYYNGTKWCGLMILLDEYFKVIRVLDRYSTGVLFSQFVKLKFDQNERIYGIDKPNSLRFVMLQNPLATLIEEYETKINYSLYIDSSNIYVDSYFESGIDISKALDTSFYVMTFQDGNLTNAKLKAVTLQIEFGESPEWKTYLSPTVLPVIANSKVYFELKDKELKVLNVYHTENEHIYRSDLSTNNLELVTNLIYTQNISEVGDILLKSNTELYVVNKRNVYSLIDCNKNIPIYTLKGTLYYGETTDNTKFIRRNGFIVVAHSYEDNGNIKSCFNFLIEGQWVPTIEDTVSGKYFFAAITNQFNLYNVYTQDRNNTLNTKSYIYAYQKYNGSNYIDIDSSIPKDVALMNNKRVWVFDRDIYSKNNFDNQVTCSVQVPNILLNNDKIIRAHLRSETNSNIFTYQNLDGIFKNVYEQLYLNFSIITNISNQKTNTQYKDGASVLMQSAFDIGDKKLSYENCQVSRYRINYIDDTSFIGYIPTKTFEPANADPFGRAKLKFIIYVANKIKSIDLLSKSGTSDVIYNTITLLDNDLSVEDLEVGKFYTIEQFVEVKEERYGKNNL